MNQVSSIPSQAVVVSSDEHLSDLERTLMVVPLLAATVFGILPFFFTSWFANITGFSSNDQFIYHIAGAVTIAYAVALTGALMDGRWIPIRPLVFAELTLNLGSLIACVLAIIGGNPPGVVYLILAASILVIAITAYLLNNHRNTPRPTPDLAQFTTNSTIIAIVLATATGAAAFFLPNVLGPLFGYKATDIFVYQQAGAATLGAAAAGLTQLLSGAWVEARWATVLASVFNGMGFLASAWSIYNNGPADPIVLPLIIGVVALPVTIATILIIQREGK